MAIDFSKFLPQDNESTAEYYKRTIGSDVPATAPAAERAVSQEVTPAARSGDRGELRVPAPEAPKPKTADDVIRNMYTAAGIDPAKAVGSAYSGARGLAASANALQVGPKQAKTMRRRGYDFATGQTTAPTAASPDLSHFERFHTVLDEFEAHVDHHQRLIEEAGGNPTSLDKVWRELGNAYAKSGAAREEHEKGDVLEKRTGNKVLAKGAHPLLGAALNHLTNAANELQIKTEGKYDAVTAGHVGHASIIRNNYGIKTPQSTESAMQAALRGAGYVASSSTRFDDDGFELSPPRPSVQRPALLSADEAKAQSEASAERRATSGRTVVVGKPRQLDLQVAPKQGPQPFSKGNDAYANQQADIRAAAQDWEPTRQKLIAKDSRKREADRAASLAESAKQRAATAPKSSPGFAAAAEKDYKRVSEARNLAPTTTPADEERQRYAEIRQTGVASVNAMRQSSEAVGLMARSNRIKQIDQDVANKTQDLISSGNIAAAASHHYGMSYLYHRDQKTVAGKRRIEAVKNSPAEYLKWHGFDAGGKEPRNEGTIPNAAKQEPMPKPSARAGGSSKVERLATGISAFANTDAPVRPRTAPSMLSPESAEEYQQKLAKPNSRAQRNNAAFRGE